MGILQHLFGHSRGHGSHHDSGHQDPGQQGAIHRPRAYERLNQIVFLGRRDRVYAGLAQLSGAQPGDAALDVGCGSGALTRALARQVGPGGSVVGVDPAPEMVDWCRGRPTDPAAAPIRYAVGPAESLELADGSVDVVASSLVVHHIAAAARPAAAAEIARVLRPGGRVLLVDIEPRSPWVQRLVAAVAGPQMAWRDRAELARLVTEAGLRLEESGRRGMLGYVRAVRPA